MAYIEQPVNYVKFLRGTPAAWETIENKDPDTLYFIANNGASTGQLYLGSKLISGGGGGSGGAVTLGDLQDVLISNNIPSDAVLIYQNNAWRPVSLETAIAAVVQTMRGATASENGLGGLVPQPTAGQQNLFLRGDATWADPAAALLGNDTGTIRSIAQSVLSEWVTGAPSTFDTLQELAAWVEDHDDAINVTQAAIDINDLTQAMFGTVQNAETHSQLVQMVQQEGVIRILDNLSTTIFGDGQQNVGLQSLVNSLQTTVNSHTNSIQLLNNAMSAASDRMDDIESDIDDLDERLRWVDVVEDNGE